MKHRTITLRCYLEGLLHDQTSYWTLNSAIGAKLRDLQAGCLHRCTEARLFHRSSGAVQNDNGGNLGFIALGLGLTASRVMPSLPCYIRMTEGRYAVSLKQT